MSPCAALRRATVLGRASRECEARRGRAAAPLAAGSGRARAAARRAGSPRATLAAALPGFFMVTPDAVVVNVALPTIGRQLGTGVSGLQWIVDGYTLMFAALLLSAGR